MCELHTIHLFNIRIYIWCTQTHWQLAWHISYLHQNEQKNKNKRSEMLRLAIAFHAKDIPCGSYVYLLVKWLIKLSWAERKPVRRAAAPPPPPIPLSPDANNWTKIETLTWMLLQMRKWKSFSFCLCRMQIFIHIRVCVFVYRSYGIPFFSATLCVLCICGLMQTPYNDRFPTEISGSQNKNEFVRCGAAFSAKFPNVL